MSLEAKIWTGWALVIAILLWAAISEAQEIIVDGESREYKIIRLELMTGSEFNCPVGEQVFDDENDFNRNGRLDDLCIGVEYDPCDIHTLQRAIWITAITGGCYSLEERERQRLRAEACNGFSPRPAYCDN